MIAEPILLLVLDLVGTFVFALDGALVALRVARLDIVGAITLGMVTAIGGGILRDLLNVAGSSLSCWGTGWSGSPRRSRCSTPPG